MGANSPNHEAVQSCLQSWSIIVPLATSFLHDFRNSCSWPFSHVHSVTYVRALSITKTLQGHHAHTEVLYAIPDITLPGYWLFESGTAESVLS
jgi:hypothetical protein